MGRPAKNEIGNTYGLLTVVSAGPKKGSAAAWMCQCACGNQELVHCSGTELRGGGRKSCGLKSNWRNRTMPDQYSCLGDQRLCTRGKSRGINAQTQKRPRAYPRTLNASSIRLTNQSSSEPPTGTRRIAFFPSLISNSSPVFSSRSEVYAFPMRRLPLPCTTAL